MVETSNKDNITVEKTLNFFWKELTYKRFVLHSLSKQRKELEKKEAQTKNEINSILKRFEREIDKNPEFFNQE